MNTFQLSVCCCVSWLWHWQMILLSNAFNWVSTCVVCAILVVYGLQVDCETGPELGQYAAELETMLQSYDLLFPVPREDHEDDMNLYRGIKQAVVYTKELALKTLVEIKRTVWLNE
jgi:hypothetical protein